MRPLCNTENQKGSGYSQFAIPTRKFETNNRAVTDLLGNFEFESYDFDHGNDTKTYFVHPNYAFHRVRFPFEVYGDTVLTKGEEVAGLYSSPMMANQLKGAEVGISSVPKEEITGVSHGRTKTDSDGRFVLPHAGVDGRASLWMKIPGQHSQRLSWYADEGIQGAASALERDSQVRF